MVVIMKLFNLPTLLTLSRLILSPLILPMLLVYLLPFNYLWLNIILTVIFLALSVTDFFDGYLARKYNCETTMGKILDPLADKFLTFSALIALLAAGKIYFYWVVILIGREFFIMGLRHVSLEYHLKNSVSMLAKIKTTVLMMAIACIILNPYQADGFHALGWNGTEKALLGIALILSLHSAYLYYQDFMMQFSQRHNREFSLDDDDDDDDDQKQEFS